MRRRLLVADNDAIECEFHVSDMVEGEYMSSDEFSTVLSELDAVADEGVLERFFQQLTVAVKKSDDSYMENGAVLLERVMGVLRRQGDDGLLRSALGFVNAVFAKTETSAFGVELIHRGLCPILVDLSVSDNANVCCQALRILKNIAGGSVMERDAIASVLSLESLVPFIRQSSNPKIQEMGCWLFRNYCYYFVPTERVQDFFCVVNHFHDIDSVTGRELLLWSLYHLRKWDKDGWAKHISQLGLLDAIVSCCSLEHYRLARAALTVLVLYGKDGGNWQPDSKLLLEMLHSGDPRYPKLALWAAEQFTILDSSYFQTLRDSGFVTDLLIFITEASFETKEEAIFCLCTMVECEPQFFFEAAVQHNILHIIADSLHSSSTKDLICSILEMLESLLAASVSDREVHSALLEIFEANFRSVFESYLDDSDEELASRVSLFLSDQIDPYTDDL